MEKNEKMKFEEDVSLKEVELHIRNTYDNRYHYMNENDLQPVDVWESLGNLETSARDNAIKYLMRFGKKEGKNPKDLYKAIHNIMFMLYSLRNERKPNSEVVEDFFDLYSTNYGNNPYL